MHVTGNAGAGGNSPTEFMLEGVAGFALGNGGIDRRTGTIVTKLRIRAGVARIPIIRINHVTGRTARRAVITRLVVGTQKPGKGVIQPGLVNIDNRHRNPRPGGRATIGLAEIRPPSFINALGLTGDVGQSGFRKKIADISPAPFEDPEYIPRR